MTLVLCLMRRCHSAFSIHGDVLREEQKPRRAEELGVVTTNLPAVSTLQLTAVYLCLIEWIYFIFAFNELFTQQTITKLA